MHDTGDYSREFLCEGIYAPPAPDESSAAPEPRMVFYLYYCPDIRELHVEQIFDNEGNVRADRAQICLFADTPRVVCEDYYGLRDVIRAARNPVVVKGFGGVVKKPARKRRKPKSNLP